MNRVQVSREFSQEDESEQVSLVMPSFQTKVWYTTTVKWQTQSEMTEAKLVCEEQKQETMSWSSDDKNKHCYW